MCIVIVSEKQTVLLMYAVIIVVIYIHFTALALGQAGTDTKLLDDVCNAVIGNACQTV